MAKTDLLAVAFTDLNGNHKYNSGKDMLIAALVDTNQDGVPSVGDTIHWGTYPNALGGSYTSPDDTITAIEVTDNPSFTRVLATTAEGTVGWFVAGDREEFATFLPAVAIESLLRDSFTDFVDEIQTNPSVPGPGPFHSFSVRNATKHTTGDI